MMFETSALRSAHSSIASFSRLSGTVERICGAAFSVLILAGFLIALWPESDARPLTNSGAFELTPNSEMVQPASLPPQWVQIRSSVLGADWAGLVRNYTPELGLQSFEFRSPPFRAEGVIGILRAGESSTPAGDVELSIRCSEHELRMPVASGSVNVNVTEALIPIPSQWCPGDAHVYGRSNSSQWLVGAGSVYQLDEISWWKRSFLGVLPYFVVAFGVVGIYGAAGALSFGRWIHPAAAAGAGIGLAATLTFLLYGFTPLVATEVSAVLLAAATVVAAHGIRTESGRRTISCLQPYCIAWFGVSFGAFALLFAAYNGSGHWEPNARFLPATWSSDLELPWMFAEALRQGADVETLFGVGGWRPTDRGPLMTGGHLLSSEIFSAMQSIGNDGSWLRGYAYNASAIVLNALWAPAVLFVLREVFKIGARASALGCLLIALTPFALFNTIYGWPKLLGGAFAILATGHAALSRQHTAPSGDVREAAGFGAASAFSILAHESNAFFLAAAAVWYFLTRLKIRPRALFLGVATGVALLAPWQLYKTLEVPSNSPLTKFALSGDFGFAHPEMSVVDLVKETYVKFDFVDWLELKGNSLVSPFAPVLTAYGDTRPINWRSFHGVDHLRQWDFYFLTAGNILLIAGFLLFCFRGQVRLLENEKRPNESMFCVVVVAGFLLQATVFVPTLFILQLPYGLILALAVVSAAALSHTRRLLVWALTAQGAYSLIVWGLAPLRAALYLDGFALVALVLMAIGLARFAVGGTHGALDGAAGNGVRHG